ncbi:NAD(P)H-dependent oxidoreductase [Limosilactobacillus secaliphilus]|uniref:NAD(P)H dehydrogenase n=1 Tax=Limosilactobacillus secaliphilus TaxID=396268 RepID=A0A0R2I005_9LACO|nr:NAD(P)H-dependent oxidoreductase [Limosilactobacillus secaliphilus]KRN58417.1 NAD(P)H dehydrogenase [Limosilactobacillus secaliphilus]
MNLLVIKGSPQKDGAATAITNKLIDGAQDGGQTITQYDAGTDPVPTLTTDGDGNFLPDDERLKKLLAELRAADIIVFSTPMYFFGMSAQMKAVVDHIMRWNEQLKTHKTGILVAVAPVDNFDHIKSEFKAIFASLGWTFGGQVLAGKISDADHLRFYPDLAYQLGKSL